ncbi:MAG: HPr kinase/phosphorylase [Alphaproteobacteria bacterium]
MTQATSIQVHATCVAIDGAGILLRGPSGAGKSDLALRLVDGGAALVADDRVDLRRRGTCLVASPPAPLRGLVEARGVGILRVPFLAAA